MKITRTDRQRAQRLWQSCSPGGKLDEARVREAVAALMQEKPRRYQAVLERLRQLAKLALAQETLTVTTAEPLTDGGAELLRGLESKLGAIKIKHFIVDPKLLGGARIQHGSTVWDSSVAARLQKLKTAIAQN